MHILCYSLYKSFIKQNCVAFSIHYDGWISSGLAFICLWVYTWNCLRRHRNISVTRIFLPAKCARIAENAEKIGYQRVSRLNCSRIYRNIEAYTIRCVAQCRTGFTNALSIWERLRSTLRCFRQLFDQIVGETCCYPAHQLVGIEYNTVCILNVCVASNRIFEVPIESYVAAYCRGNSSPSLAT